MKRHSFDLISAAFGAVFIWLGVVAVTPGISVPANAVWPLLAVILGVGIVVSAVRRPS